MLRSLVGSEMCIRDRFLNVSTGDATAVFDPSLISYYIPFDMYNRLNIYKSDRSMVTVGFGDTNITYNIPVVCNANLTAPNIYNKVEIDNKFNNYYTKLI